jgi:hypothetical protein
MPALHRAAATGRAGSPRSSRLGDSMLGSQATTQSKPFLERADQPLLSRRAVRRPRAAHGHERSSVARCQTPFRSAGARASPARPARPPPLGLQAGGRPARPPAPARPAGGLQGDRALAQTAAGHRWLCTASFAGTRAPLLLMPPPLPLPAGAGAAPPAAAPPAAADAVAGAAWVAVGCAGAAALAAAAAGRPCAGAGARGACSWASGAVSAACIAALRMPGGACAGPTATVGASSKNAKV